MNNIAIKLNNIQKSFGEESVRNQVLFDINLEIYLSQLTMIVGPSGCGKTTLINLIGGILNPDSGSIIVLDEEITSLTDFQKSEFRKRNIGFIFQQFNLIPTLTVQENIAIPLMINNYSYKEALNRTINIIDEVELGARSNYSPKQLSGGEQQRVAIARSVITNPKLVICDEPTSSLDGKTGRKIVEMLKSIALEEGKAVIIVTHDTRIFKYADRIVRMDDGRIVSARNVSREGN